MIAARVAGWMPARATASRPGAGCQLALWVLAVVLDLAERGAGGVEQLEGLLERVEDHAAAQGRAQRVGVGEAVGADEAGLDAGPVGQAGREQARGEREVADLAEAVDEAQALDREGAAAHGVAGGAQQRVEVAEAEHQRVEAGEADDQILELRACARGPC